MSLQYIIDGYNLINHPLFERQHKNPADAQRNVLNFIRINRLTGSAKNKVNIVFDGFPPAGTSSLESAHTCVIFSGKITADEKIKRMVEESGQRRSIVVVSDDKEIGIAVRALGAKSMRIEEFSGAKDRHKRQQKKELLKPELNYSQMHKITEELRKIWLKP